MNKFVEQQKRFLLSEYFLLSIILILGFFVRLYKIENPVADWHSWRQADTASVSRVYLEKGLNLFYPRYHDISSIQTGIFNPNGYRFVEFPFFNLVHALLSANFNFLSFEVWGRLVSILSSMISTLLIFVIGKRFLGKWGGVLSSFFFAFLPYNIYFTRVILPEPMAVSLVLASIWLYILFNDKEKFFYLYLSAAFFALSMLIKPFTFFYLVPLFYLAVKKYGISKIFKDASVLIHLLVFANIVLVPFFLWRVWINQYPAGIPFFEWAFNGDRIRFRPSFWRWIFGERLGHLILGSWGLIPFSFGLLAAKAKEYFIHLTLLGMFLYVVVIATASVRHDYYQIITIPPVALALAQGTLYLWQTRQFPKLLSRTLLVFALLMMFIVSALQVKEFYKINHPEIVEAGTAADKIAPKDALVIAPYNGDTAFLYQTRRWGWPVVEDSFANLIKKGASFYVSVNINDPDTKQVAGKYQVLEKTDKYIIMDLRKPLK